MFYPLTLEEMTILRDDVMKALKVQPNFPKEGVRFIDIQPVLYYPGMFYRVCQAMASLIVYSQFLRKELGTPKLLALESRGFLFGSVISVLLGVPLILARKKGKLPGECESIEYKCEYGTGVFEVQKACIEKGDSVIIVDDIFATGNTAKAMNELVKKMGSRVIGVATFLELDGLKDPEVDERVLSFAKVRTTEKEVYVQPEEYKPDPNMNSRSEEVTGAVEDKNK